MAVFINELHYDNLSGDTGEAIEVAGTAGTSLSGWRLVLYNGNGGASYATINLSGVLPDQQNGFGTLSFAATGLQNGSPDGVALVDASNTVVQFLSYEGSFTAVGGPADGLTSTDIGVSQPDNTPVGQSLRLVGSGDSADDFTWATPAASSFGTIGGAGAINQDQSFTTIVEPPEPTAPIINEALLSHVGIDTSEFVEFKGDPNTDYSGYSLLQIEGDSESPTGRVDSVITLSVTDANGLLATGFLNNAIENGSVTLLLVKGFSGGVGDDLDTNDDGVLDATPWVSIADSVAFSDGGAGDRTYSTVVLTPGFDGGSATVGGASRIPDGTDTNTAADWKRNDFDGEGLTGFIGTPAFGEAINTPGAANEAVLPTARTIYEIQGAGHASAFAGQAVTTTGVVTAIDTNGARGFFIQDATGDGDIATSDGIFVFTNALPTVSVGQLVQVSATVSEFFPGGAASGGLSITELVSPSVSVLGTGSVVATVIGADGRMPPTNVIDDDGLASYDPTADGIDFYESLEGMLVTVADAKMVAPTALFSGGTNGELWTVADGGAGATGINSRGGITIGADDFNPERVQIQLDSGVQSGFFTAGVVSDGFRLNTGATLGDVTGVVSYNFGNFEVLARDLFTPTNAAPAVETTTLAGSADQLTVASYNVLNLDPNDLDGDTDVASGRFEAIAQQIVNNLGSPDVISLQEVQDNDGSTNSSVTDASVTLQMLVDAIAAAGGPTYAFIDNPPADDTSGGQPGANIRVAMLYNPERVSLVDGSVKTITDPNLGDGDAFEDSRQPLQASFAFHDNEYTVIANHSTSRTGSTPLFGATQPPINAGDDQREAQAQVINNAVDAILADDATANVIVAGDFNGFQFEEQFDILQGGADPVLSNLGDLLPEEERYSFIFDGNSQDLDHMLVSDALVAGAAFDIVHANIDFSRGTPTSDHDPGIAQFTIDADQRLNGGNRDDALTGGTGDDVIQGGNGDDTLSGAGGADLIIGGNGNDDIAGGSGGDTLIAGNGDDIVDGDAGNDGITGGNGNDRIAGGTGNDTLAGENGNDILDGGAGNDAITGGNGNDQLGGGLGADLLLGGNGNDTLAGGDDDDTMAGGNGGDRFVFEVGTGSDLVLDFQTGDVIDLTAFDFASANEVLQAAHQEGANTVIDLTGGDEVVLAAVNLNTLLASSIDV